MVFENSVNILKSGVGSAYPCVAYAVGRGAELLDSGVMGDRRTYPDRAPADENTLFDLASLTKLVATTQVALKFIEKGDLLLTDTLGRYFPEAVGTERENVTVLQLMTHSSGITPHIALENVCKDVSEATATIINSKPFCKPGEDVYYSCMGYMLLQKILEKISGEPLDALAKRLVFDPLGMENTGFCPKSSNIASTEFSKTRGRYICGEVHDENAYWLGGVSGNAGLFSNLGDMIKFAKMIASDGVADGKIFINPRLFEKAIHNYTPGKNENRGLGFQLTADISGLTGDLFAAESYGHTGFTGTALYVDRETKLWGLLLTNAVHYGRENKGPFFRIRRRFYNSITDEYLRGI